MALLFSASLCGMDQLSLGYLLCSCTHRLIASIYIAFVHKSVTPFTDNVLVEHQEYKEWIFTNGGHRGCQILFNMYNVLHY